MLLGVLRHLENRPEGKIDASEIKITTAGSTRLEPVLLNLSFMYDFDN
jgi:hypothetical protein